MLSCNTCEKKFTRNIDLTRHLNRKTPCYKNLNCYRCGVIFKQKIHLTDHLNRKFPCEDKRVIIDLKIKLEETKLKVEQEKTKGAQEKTKGEQEKTKGEQEKTKGENCRIKLEQERNRGKRLDIQSNRNINQTAGRDINNVFNININNIENLDQHQFTYAEAAIAHSEDILTLISNIFKHQYNSPDSDLNNNKCLRLSDNKYLVKTNGLTKKANFTEIRKHILKNYKYLIDTTVGNFIQPENTEIIKKNILPEYKIDGYEKSLNFTHNIRNNGILDKTLKEAIPESAAQVSDLLE
jgi:uncharacterized C2H2 Zn-finger protein